MCINLDYVTLHEISESASVSYNETNLQSLIFVYILRWGFLNIDAKGKLLLYIH